MSRTNIVLDDNLLKKAFRLSKAKTKKELIHEALKEFIAARSRKNLSKIRGKIKFAEGYNYKTLRIGRDERKKLNVSN